MRRTWVRIAIATVTLAVLAGAISYVVKQRQRRSREAAYNLALHSYQTEFESKKTRAEIEDSLTARRIHFRQICCIDQENSAYSDLVRIGEEPAPWYCSQYNVYVAFTFGASEGPHFGPPPSKVGGDRLKSITIYRWLEECL